MSREATAGTVITAGFDYLTPEVNRPDLFEERYTMRSGLGRSGSTNQIGITVLTVVFSAFIFITIVAWATLLATWYDSRIVSDVITPLVTSRFYYAVTVTFISLMMALLFYYIYINIR